MQSVMEHKFSEVPRVEIQRSVFDRSHGVKTTFDAGPLVPIYVDEALPGDSINLKMSAFARLATPIKPIMDNMFLETFFFAVPIRLIWDNWKKMMGEQKDPADSIDFTIPQITIPANGPEIGSLSDYMGFPTDITNGYTASALWHRAYNLIYNEWFRDQNLQNSLVVDTDDGPDTLTDYVLKSRGKRHDYFTSCLPWPQKQTAEVTIPLGGKVPVDYTAAPATSQVLLRKASDRTLWGGATSDLQVETATNRLVESGLTDLIIDPNTTLEVDLTAVTGATINALRLAFQTQKLLEKDARGGTRYTELLKVHFGVTSPDSRLQRPEYLGGGSSPINIHPVPQMTATPAVPTNTDSQGNLAGFGTGSFTGHGFSKSFTEHCVLIGLVNVRADLTYQQGLNRMFSRSSRYDFYWPSFATIGEQAVLNKEIWLDGSANDILTFGYQERYAEYRYKPSMITGQFRSDAPTSLEIWHLSQDFATLPALNSTFITEAPPIDRVIAVPAEPHFLFDGYFEMKTARPMPLYGVPGQMDRF